MELNEIILAAANGSIPEGLNMAEKLFYYQAKELYVGFAKGDISKEKGAELKKEYIAAYRQNMSKLKNGEAAMIRWGKFFAAVESAIMRHNKEQSAESFNHLKETIYHFAT